jgi:hypothetical protein
VHAGYPDSQGRDTGETAPLRRIGARFAHSFEGARAEAACGQGNDAREVAKRNGTVTNSDWIAGMMGALAIAALLWVAVAFA